MPRAPARSTASARGETPGSRWSAPRFDFTVSAATNDPAAIWAQVREDPLAEGPSPFDASPRRQPNANPITGLLRCWPPIEPWKGAPKAKSPPSEATS